MDPTSSLLVGHVAGKILDKVGTIFKTHVIDRWSRRRAEVFFEQFCIEISGGEDYLEPAEIEARFARIAEDEICSEIMFDAYRSVALAKSRDLGPRIIALMAARVIAERRFANDMEATIYVAAENLTDEELLGAQRFVREQQQKLPPEEASQRFFRIKWHEESIDSSLLRRGSAISTAPLDMHDSFGAWAAKLKLYGLISDDVKERQFDYQPGERRHSMDGGSVRTIEWWIDISSACLTLVELVERARAQDHPPPTERTSANVY